VSVEDDAVEVVLIGENDTIEAAKQRYWMSGGDRSHVSVEADASVFHVKPLSSSQMRRVTIAQAEHASVEARWLAGAFVAFDLGCKSITGFLSDSGASCDLQRASWGTHIPDSIQAEIGSMIIAMSKPGPKTGKS
jgi:hypothetical protein